MNCSSCGDSIPDGQGSSCSMCYGDIDHGTDGNYREWAIQQAEEAARQEQECEEWYREQGSVDDCPI